MDENIELETNLDGPTPSFEKINETYAKVFGENWVPEDQTLIKSVEIKDLPVLIKNDGTIVCIPKLPEMGLIAVVGLTGTGKTLLSGYIVDSIYYSWEDYIAIMNDSQEETYSWSEPCDNFEFIQIHKKLNQTPVALPMIYVYPNFVDFQMPEDYLEEKNSVTVSIPFREIMNNIQKYIPDLGASEKYLMNKKDELLDVENTDDLIQLIRSIDTGTKGMAEVVRKIESSFRQLIDDGLLNISSPETPSHLATFSGSRRTYLGNPFTAIMKAECIPAFVTSDLYARKYKDGIYSYYLDALFEESLKGNMKGKRVWLYFDELTRVVHADPKFSSVDTERALGNISSRGRNNGISLIYATQRYNEIPKAIRSQTKYALIFRHKSAEETKMICDDFSLGRESRKDILNLKKYEVIATTTEYFVCYKKDKKWEEHGPIAGRIIPALHKNKFLNRK